MLFHVVLIMVIFCGIFFGTLPDLWPSILSRLPYFSRLDSGIKKLSRPFTSLDRNDRGYIPVYRLLRTVAPNILPPLQEVLALPRNHGTAELIKVKSGFIWQPTVQGKKTKNPISTIYVCFRTQENTVDPICEFRDLMFIVRDFKTRWCSRMGFFFAFLALLFGEGISLRKSVKFWLNESKVKSIKE